MSPTGNFWQRMLHWLLLPWRLRDRLIALETAHQQLQATCQELQATHQQLHANTRALENDSREQALALQSVRQDHDAVVQWLRSVYPEIMAAIARKIEQPQIDEWRERIVATVIREASTPPGEAAVTARAPTTAPADAEQDDFYLALERRFRGTREDVAERLRPYLAHIAASPAAGPVVDVGCGRGEWLQLLQDSGIAAVGVDTNAINGSSGRAAGLEVVTADALDYLTGQPAGSLKAVTAFHVVEHLPFPLLLGLTHAAYDALAPGGVLIFETPNPENMLVATRSFWIDPTHLRPLPAELLGLLVEHCGFEAIEVVRLHPASEASGAADPVVQALLDGPRDYAIIARKPLTAA